MIYTNGKLCLGLTGVKKYYYPKKPDNNYHTAAVFI
jgi:hypothetical protein